MAEQNETQSACICKECLGVYLADNPDEVQDTEDRCPTCAENRAKFLTEIAETEGIDELEKRLGIVAREKMHLCNIRTFLMELAENSDGQSLKQLNEFIMALNKMLKDTDSVKIETDAVIEREELEAKVRNRMFG